MTSNKILKNKMGLLLLHEYVDFCANVCKITLKHLRQNYNTGTTLENPPFYLAKNSIVRGEGGFPKFFGGLGPNTLVN
jgi:hypothetical protein